MVARTAKTFNRSVLTYVRIKSLSSPEPTLKKAPKHLRKEVIQPQVPLRLPCYDFTPVIGHTVDGALLAVRRPASGAADFHGVTGGVYKARERIHRGKC